MLLTTFKFLHAVFVEIVLGSNHTSQCINVKIDDFTKNFKEFDRFKGLCIILPQQPIFKVRGKGCSFTPVLEYLMSPLPR